VNSTAVLAGIAVVGGMAVTLQGQFMGQMDRNIGTVESAFITYGVGAVCVGLKQITGLLVILLGTYLVVSE
jgi:transporter family-2 protein